VAKLARDGPGHRHAAAHAHHAGQGGHRVPRPQSREALAGRGSDGAWTFRRESPAYNGISPFDYNDIRIALGTEFVPKTTTGLAGNFEVGYVFYRQLFYVDGPPQYQDLPSTIMFRLGLSY